MVLTNLLNIQPTMERHTHLSLAHVNAWSIRNKIGPFQLYLQDEKIDLCAVTETWLKPDNMVLPREITPLGYNILSQSTSASRQEGAVALRKPCCKLAKVCLLIKKFGSVLEKINYYIMQTE